ncbi:hypothetical protein RF11_03221 [Thelohanellus kitauei]|uniref:Uncharacterized protein n=1 Tax=Thelohanellus kitauei TaxID=669202 RepID=A0A0C2MB22_THEKT|nr:hypothetical protein RF11_03221 [Thelohanellus kitauei]
MLTVVLGRLNSASMRQIKNSNWKLYDEYVDSRGHRLTFSRADRDSDKWAAFGLKTLLLIKIFLEANIDKSFQEEDGLHVRVHISAGDKKLLKTQWFALRHFLPNPPFQAHKWFKYHRSMNHHSIYVFKVVNHGPMKHEPKSTLRLRY